MSEKTGIPEALIEELGGILYGLYNLVPEAPKGRSIQEAIIRIGGAILSGEYPALDEAFGVVGRGEGTALVFEDGDVWATWTEAFRVDKSCEDNEPLEFIALRQGKGAGEKGEASGRENQDVPPEAATRRE